MKTEKQIQREVRVAVKDYVDGLISQRTGPGKGMAVSASDLMLAAKSVGKTNPQFDTNQLLQQFANTGIQVIHGAPKPDAKIRLHGSQLTYGPVIKKKPTTNNTTNNTTKEKREHHWLTWRTSPTPTPPPTADCQRPSTASVRAATPAPQIAVTPAPRPQTATQRPTTPANRPKTPSERVQTPFTERPFTPIDAYSQADVDMVNQISAARPQSARPPTGMNDNNARNSKQYIYQKLNLAIRPDTRSVISRYVPPATPALSEMSLPAHLAPTPEPPTTVNPRSAATYRTPARPKSEMGMYNTNNNVDRVRSQTPGAVSARSISVSDNLSVYQDVVGTEQCETTNSPFVPALQSWAANANDYERDVAYSLFQALGGKAPNAHKKPIRLRPKSAMAVAVKTNRYQSQRRAPVAGVQTSESAWETYQRALQQEQELALSGKSVIHSYNPARSYKPVNVNRKLKVFPPTEYTCESSFFLNSMVPFKRHFTINPEWSSEYKNAAVKTNSDIRKSFQSTRK